MINVDAIRTIKGIKTIEDFKSLPIVPDGENIDFNRYAIYSEWGYSHSFTLLRDDDESYRVFVSYEVEKYSPLLDEFLMVRFAIHHYVNFGITYDVAKEITADFYDEKDDLIKIRDTIKRENWHMYKRASRFKRRIKLLQDGLDLKDGANLAYWGLSLDHEDQLLSTNPYFQGKEKIAA